MPFGGGDPKVLGDGLIVKVRPTFGRGNAAIWDLRDGFIALMEELDFIFAASQLADFPAFKAALTAGRTVIKVVDTKDSEL